MISKIKANILLSCIFISSLCQAQLMLEDITRAFENGTTSLNFRLRYEKAQIDKLADANATTLRSELTFTTDNINDFKIKLGLIDVSSIFGQDYDPAIAPLEKPNYAKIYDPKGTGLSEASIAYLGIMDTNIRLGRQFILLDNERFIGSDEFRQYPQSFDALSINSTALVGFNLYYAFILNVNTTNSNVSFTGGRRSLRTHIINLDWNEYLYGTVGAYLYFNNDKDIPEYSNITYGIRLYSNDENDFYGFNYLIEIARQESKFKNPNIYNAHYAHLELSKKIENVSFDLGWEHLGAASAAPGEVFYTSLGSNHKFNGLADAFYPQTPDDGLNDYYLAIHGGNPQLELKLAYHLFYTHKNFSTSKIGSEVDVSIDFIFNPQLKLNVSYTQFHANNIAFSDTSRVWFMLHANIL